MNFRSRMAAFLQGRYGIDQLYYGLLGLYLFLILLRVFIHTPILTWIGLVVLLLAVLRTMSKRIAARRRENELFLKVWRPVKNWFVLCRNRIRDRKTYRYRRCRHCRAILRLPVKKGKHTARCPKCDRTTEVRILF